MDMIRIIYVKKYFKEFMKMILGLISEISKISWIYFYIVGINSKWKFKYRLLIIVLNMNIFRKKFNKICLSLVGKNYEVWLWLII